MEKLISKKENQENINAMLGEYGLSRISKKMGKTERFFGEKPLPEEQALEINLYVFREAAVEALRKLKAPSFTEQKKDSLFLEWIPYTMKPHTTAIQITDRVAFISQNTPSNQSFLKTLPPELLNKMVIEIDSKGRLLPEMVTYNMIEQLITSAQPETQAYVKRVKEGLPKQDKLRLAFEKKGITPLVNEITKTAQRVEGIIRRGRVATNLKKSLRAYFEERLAEQIQNCSSKGERING